MRGANSDKGEARRETLVRTGHANELSSIFSLVAQVPVLLRLLAHFLVREKCALNGACSMRCPTARDVRRPNGSCRFHARHVLQRESADFVTELRLYGLAGVYNDAGLPAGQRGSHVTCGRTFFICSIASMALRPRVPFQRGPPRVEATKSIARLGF
jgi:hypothetical protein